MSSLFKFKDSKNLLNLLNPREKNFSINVFSDFKQSQMLF